MAWSGGTFTRTNGTYSGAAVWTSDASAAIKIRADRHDTHDADLAAGINACMHKGGQNQPTANIDWGGFKITNLAAATTNGDAVRWQQIVPVTGGAFTGDVSTSGAWTDAQGNVRDIPLNTQNATYQFVLLDRGRGVIKTNTTAYTWTVPLESTTNFPNGTAISIENDGSAGAVTISPAGGVTLLDGATSGSFLLAANTARTLRKVGTNRWRIY